MLMTKNAKRFSSWTSKKKQWEFISIFKLKLIDLNARQSCWDDELWVDGRSGLIVSQGRFSALIEPIKSNEELIFHE